MKDNGRAIGPPVQTRQRSAGGPWARPPDVTDQNTFFTVRDHSRGIAGWPLR
jgi:hypothetical protein